MCKRTNKKKRKSRFLKFIKPGPEAPSRTFAKIAQSSYFDRGALRMSVQNIRFIVNEHQQTGICCSATLSKLSDAKNVCKCAAVLDAALTITFVDYLIC